MTEHDNAVVARQISDHKSHNVVLNSVDWAGGISALIEPREPRQVCPRIDSTQSQPQQMEYAVDLRLCSLVVAGFLLEVVMARGSRYQAQELQ